MRKASWILLTVVGTLIFLFSLLSASVAYFQPGRDVIDGKTFAPSDQKGPDGRTLEALDLPDSLETAIRARRGTAAAFGAAFGFLFLATVLGPYRRGDRGAWWSILLSLVVLAAVTWLRKPTLGTDLGLGAPTILLVVSTVALLLDVKRLKQS